MIHSLWLDFFWIQKVDWTLVQKREKNMPLLCSQWESFSGLGWWWWWGRLLNSKQDPGECTSGH